MPPHEVGLVGIATGIVDRADAVQDGSVSSKGVSVDRDDDAVARQSEQLAVFRFGRARQKAFRRQMDGKAVVVEVPVERE